MAVPSLVRTGPFSYDEPNYAANRTYALTKSKFGNLFGSVQIH